MDSSANVPPASTGSSSSSSSLPSYKSFNANTELDGDESESEVEDDDNDWKGVVVEDKSSSQERLHEFSHPSQPLN